MSHSPIGALRVAAMAIALAMGIGLMVVAGAFVGQWLDRRWGTSPWLTLTGAFMGLIGAVLQMLSTLGRWERGNKAALHNKDGN